MSLLTVNRPKHRSRGGLFTRFTETPFYIGMFGENHPGATDKPLVLPDQGVLREGDGIEYLETEAEALQRELARELAEIEAQTKAEFNAIFAPFQDGVEHLFSLAFDMCESAAGLESGTCHDLYMNTVRIQAEAENFGRELATGDIHKTQELDMRELRRMLLADALLVS